MLFRVKMNKPKTIVNYVTQLQFHFLFKTYSTIIEHDIQKDQCIHI